MLLSDKDIKQRLDDGSLVIDPLRDPDVQIQPCSVDFRLGRELLVADPESESTVIRPQTGAGLDTYVSEVVIGEDTPAEEYILSPGDFVLGTTIERVEIPSDLVSFVEGRSSIGRLAVTIHSTAGLVDPGYQGQVTLEISNEGVSPVALTPGMRIGQFTFQPLSSSAERPYGSDRDSKYQSQMGPESSRVSSDSEFHD